MSSGRGTASNKEVPCSRDQASFRSVCHKDCIRLIESPLGSPPGLRLRPELQGARSTIGERMRLLFHLAFSCLATCFLLIGPLPQSFAQQARLTPARDTFATFPDAPEPQFARVNSSAPGRQPASLQGETSIESLAAADQADVVQESSSAQSPAVAQESEKTQRENAQEQIKEQEHQRVLGILPAFNTSYRDDAVSLTAKEKISVAFRSAVDPVAFGSALVVAGLKEGLDDDSQFGWGPAGYGKRAGAAYLDAFDGTMIGNGFLPAILHQDPRYFRLGHGTAKHRLIYSVASGFICKHDTTHKWEPNYSNMLGNMAAGAISNLYYSTDDSGFGQTVSDGLVVTAEGTLGSVFQEFWPDISRKSFHKDPTRGLDAEARADDEAAKRAKDNTR